MSNLADQPASDSASDSHHVGDVKGKTHRADNLSSGNPPEDMKNEEFLIENPIIDLLDAQINQHENILGNRWLERGTVATIVGPSGVGKSMVAVQICVEAAAGVEVFGMRVPRPLRVLLVQSEDSKNDRIEQVQCIRPIALSQSSMIGCEIIFGL
jgi:hypothetical protein